MGVAIFAGLISIVYAIYLTLYYKKVEGTVIERGGMHDEILFNYEGIEYKSGLQYILFPRRVGSKVDILINEKKPEGYTVSIELYWNYWIFGIIAVVGSILFY